MKNLARLALLLFVVATVAPSCATTAVAIPVIIAAVQGADLAVNAIADFAAGWFTVHPDASLQKTVDVNIQRVRDSLLALNALTAGAADVSQGQLSAAFGAFETAYNALLAVVSPMGVHAGASATIRAEAGGLTVPPASSFRPAAIR